MRQRDQETYERAQRFVPGAATLPIDREDERIVDALVSRRTSQLGSRPLPDSSQSPRMRRCGKKNA